MAVPVSAEEELVIKKRLLTQTTVARVNADPPLKKLSKRRAHEESLAACLRWLKRSRQVLGAVRRRGPGAARGEQRAARALPA
jgi:hypothetical protein